MNLGLRAGFASLLAGFARDGPGPTRPVPGRAFRVTFLTVGLLFTVTGRANGGSTA